MSSFQRLLTSLDSDPGKRGKQFEHFVKWFLTTDPEWTTQVARVWLWDEWPGRWGRDCGIDLIFEHRNGQTWAVQAKCYAPEYEVTKADVDKFLSETNRKAIDHRLLVATTDLLGANARQVCEGQDKSVVRCLLSDFESAAVDYPENFAALATGRRKAPPQPRPYRDPPFFGYDWDCCGRPASLQSASDIDPPKSTYRHDVTAQNADHVENHGLGCDSDGNAEKDGVDK